MSDDVKALIAEARRVIETEDSDWLRVDALLASAHAALEAATVAPAVDREALAKVIEFASGEAFLNGARGQLELSLASADAVIAHLGVRDVRDVQAEALEQAAGAMYGDAVVIGGVPGWLRARAQAIREARSER